MQLGRSFNPSNVSQLTREGKKGGRPKGGRPLDLVGVQLLVGQQLSCESWRPRWKVQRPRAADNVLVKLSADQVRLLGKWKDREEAGTDSEVVLRMFGGDRKKPEDPAACNVRGVCVLDEERSSPPVLGGKLKAVAHRVQVPVAILKSIAELFLPSEHEPDLAKYVRKRMGEIEVVHDVAALG